MTVNPVVSQFYHTKFSCVSTKLNLVCVVSFSRVRLPRSWILPRLELYASITEIVTTTHYGLMLIVALKLNCTFVSVALLIVISW